MNTFVRKTFSLPTLFLLLSAPLVAGEFNRDALVTTVGQVVDVDGENYAYLLWQPGDPMSALGNDYGVYVKEGEPGDPGSFHLLGRTTLQVSHQTTLSLLRLGHLIDAHGEKLAPRVDALFREAIAQPGSEPVLRPSGPTVGPGEPDLDTAEKLQYLIGASINATDSLNQLFFFGRTHPGVMMTLGHGYAVPMPHAVSTFEIRLLSPAGTPLRVVGRATLDVNNPIQLPPPGPPVQVLHDTQMGHAVTSAKDVLVARMRWSMDDDLRRELPAANGYDIFRIPETTADTLGFTGPTGPPTQNLLAAVEDGHADRVNSLPIYASPLLTELEAADLDDRETFHYADDNDLAGGGDPHQDGDRFYYYIAARDVTGRPGAVSPGTLFVIAHRLPPLPPDNIEVRNRYIGPDYVNAETVDDAVQHLEVVITQHPDFPYIGGDPDPRQISEYHIYRWETPRAYLSEGGNPATSLVGSVPHVPGEKFAVFLDDGPGAPESPADFGRTWYYTVRAVDSASVTPNWSAHSGPAFGVLRDRRSPDGPDAAEITASETTVVATFPDREFTMPFDALGLSEPLPEGIGFFVQISRADPDVTDWRVEIIETSGDIRDARQGSFHSGQNMIRVLFAEPLADNLRARVSGRALPGAFGDFAMGSVPLQPQSDPNYVWVIPFELETQFLPVGTDPASPWNFHVVTQPDGGIVPVTGNLLLPPDTYSWRVYRRVRPGGEPDLVASGHGEPLPPSVAWQDDNPPLQPGLTVCYYVQIFDMHGNASPMRRVGECLTMRKSAGQLPTPVIISAESLEADPNGNPRVRLSWFSERVNVERFELAVSTGSGGGSEAEGEHFGPIAGEGVFLEVDEDESAFFRRYQTIRATALSGSGRFDVEMTLLPAQAYSFAVRAVGPGEPDRDIVGPPNPLTRAASPWTDTVRVTWREPDPAPGVVIPWPARELPSLLNTNVPVTAFPAGTGPYHATRLFWAIGEGGDDGGGDDGGDDRNGDGGEETAADLLPGVGIFLGAIPGGNINVTYGTEGLGDSSRLTPIATFNEAGDLDLEDRLFHPAGAAGHGNQDAGSDLLPFVVYRHQVPTQRFPQAVPNLLQVSPLIEAINTTQIGAGSSFVLRDPYIVPVSLSQVPVPMTGLFDIDDPQAIELGLDFVSAVPPNDRPAYLGDSENGLYWVDHMPVIEGAAYRYLIVQFASNGEIRRIIPTNTVEF